MLAAMGFSCKKKEARGAEEWSKTLSIGQTAPPRRPCDTAVTPAWAAIGVGAHGRQATWNGLTLLNIESVGIEGVSPLHAILQQHSKSPIPISKLRIGSGQHWCYFNRCYHSDKSGAQQFTQMSISDDEKERTRKELLDDTRGCAATLSLKAALSSP